MSAREWQPGDVAVVDDPAYGERIMVRRDTPTLGSCWHALDDDRCLDAKQAGDARPLVVIDPEEREQVERLMNTVLATINDRILTRGVSNAQAALREFANPTPAKPEEPTGLGAVVVAGDGREWIHHGRGKWMRDDAMVLEWADLTILRVLSEGVTQ